MNVSFVKAQALGNDFVIIPLQQKGMGEFSTDNLARIVRFVANRRFGIGCDQVIFIDAPKDPNTAMFVRFFNADGSEAESCGNGSRALGLWWMLKNETNIVTFQSMGGLVTIKLIDPDAGLVEMILPLPVADTTIYLGEYQAYSDPAPVFVMVGNPHVVLFSDNDDAAELWGRVIEKLPVFPAGTNVNFVTQVCQNTVHLTVWERGVGLTPACGTGAAATAVAAAARGLVNGNFPVTVIQAGGSLVIDIKHNNLVQRGKAGLVFEGKVSFDGLH